MTATNITTDALRTAFAPSGKLRASINLGNPILANRHPGTGEPFGVSIDLSNEFARRLGVDVELVVFDGAAKSVDAVKNELADIGFFAIDPLRGDGISFTAPYVLIEGSYLVRHNSPLQSNEQVDRAGIRVAVGQGSAYDLFLTRELKHAEIIRAPGAQGAFDAFHHQGLEVVAGIRQMLAAEVEAAMRLASSPGLRLLPGRFMVIQQAMGCPSGRGAEAATYLRGFVESMKASGFVADALKRHGIQGASVAP
jgi:polar amino acid transport system substrate-binding protein